MSFKKKALEDDASALADDLDDPVADPAASDSSGGRPTLSKRTFLKGAATAPFAAAGARYSIGRSRAVAPIGVGVALGAGAAAGYLTRKAEEYFTGNGVDSESYQNLNDSELHAEVRQDAVSIREADESVLTNLNNLLNNATNAAFSEAKYAAIEQMNTGATESETLTAAKDAVNEFYSVQEKNVLDHLSIQCAKCNQMVNKVDSQLGFDNAQIMSFVNSSGSVQGYVDSGEASLRSVTTTLPNGENYSFDQLMFGYHDGSGGTQLQMAVYRWENSNPLRDHAYIIKPTDGGSNIKLVIEQEYGNVLEKIDTQVTQVRSDIETWVSGVYPNYSSGDISLSDMVSASELANKAPNESGFSYAGADLALLGVEGADHRLEIELIDSATIVTGTIYAQGRTAKLDTGTVYSPSEISGTVWLAYEKEGDDGQVTSDLVALEQDFQILSATDMDGNSRETVTFSSRNQQTTDQDIQKIQDELQQLSELEQELNKQQEDAATGGGGMSLDQFSIGSIPGAGVVAIFVGGALWLFSQDDN